MPELHAKLSPSSSERWFACPGSIVLSRDIPERSSVYSEEGRKAHGLAEAMLKGRPCALGYKAEMRDNVRVYVDHVKALAVGPSRILQVEQEVKVSEDCWGTADALVWDPESKTLHVRDLKYGAGVAVEVQNNLQLKIYGLASLLTSGYPAETVNVGIIQPRLPHADGPSRSKDYQAVDLIEFHADLLDAIKRVRHAESFGELYLDKWRNSSKQIDKDAMAEWEETHLHPTAKGCQFCPAAPTCPKVKALAQETAKQVFSVATVDNGGVRSYDPAELARTLELLPILEGWIKNVREFAYAEAEKGHDIPHHKLVEKRPSRKWKDETEAGESLDMLGIDCFEKKLLTPAAVEKLLPKDQRGLLESLTVRESSGHTLVHESDKREAVRIDARSAFGELSETAGETDSH